MDGWALEGQWSKHLDAWMDAFPWPSRGALLTRFQIWPASQWRQRRAAGWRCDTSPPPHPRGYEMDEVQGLSPEAANTRRFRPKFRVSPSMKFPDF